MKKENLTIQGLTYFMRFQNVSQYKTQINRTKIPEID